MARTEDDAAPARYRPRSRSRSRSRSRERDRPARPPDRLWDDRHAGGDRDGGRGGGTELRHEPPAPSRGDGRDAVASGGPWAARERFDDGRRDDGRRDDGRRDDGRSDRGGAAGRGRDAPPAAARRGGGRDDRFVDDEEEEDDVGAAGAGGALPPPLPRDGGDALPRAPLPPPAPPPPPAAAELAPPPGVSDEDFMAQVLGFGGFDSTKGKHVADNDTSAARGAVARTLKREYRQYMHRKGGFNKPLAPQAPIKKK